jgi:hypothetical protein
MDFFEIIRPLEGVVDGVNRTFTVPTRFVLGTTQAMVNGVSYASGDAEWGYVELNPTTIRFNRAPKSGFVLSLFYREARAEGSPFSGGVIP